MANWLTSLTSKLGSMMGGRTPSAHVGVFGKHPGWDDHIDDLGLDSHGLVAAKQYLYIQGIGGCIDSGKWQEENGATALIPYGHMFVWRDGANLLAGRLWPSSDGKNRTRYPMVICVHLRHRAAQSWPDVTRFLEDMESACKAATSAEQVIQLASSARLAATHLLDAPAANLPGRAEIAAKLNLKPDSEAAQRIAYAANSYFGLAQFPSGTEINLKLEMVKVSPQHLRVPALPAAPQASMSFWQDFFSNVLPAQSPQLYIASLTEPWVDVIIGTPTPKHLVCIRAAGAAVPLASEIPFDIPSAEREAAQKYWSAFLAAPAAPL